MSKLDDVLEVLQVAEEVASEFPPLAVGSAIAQKVTAIAQAAYDAHVAFTGQPLDLTKLKQIAPVPITGS